MHARRLRVALLVAVLLVPVLAAMERPRDPANAASSVAGRAPTTPLDVRVVADEPEAVLAIARKTLAKQPVAEADWQRLFASEGYVRLKKREASLNRTFTDDEFRAFVLSEKTLGGVAAYEAQLAAWKALDARAAAAAARVYLPRGARLRGTIYPSIKPRQNSFVFELTTHPAIFFYMNPDERQAVSENTLAHELHHVGFAAACQGGVETKQARYPEATRHVIDMVGSFSEGLAMVAAAGGPDVHPHAGSPSEIRAGWDRDVATFDQDVRKVEALFLDVLEGRLTDEAEIQKRHMDFFGFQGPWYTVGWRMAVTIEQAYGRDAVIDAFCDWTTLPETFNRAAAKARAGGGPPLATWSDKVVAAFVAPAH